MFRLLVRRYPEFVAAGELAKVLDVKPNTMSAHLSALVRAGLLKQRRDGRHLLYQADMDGADDLVSYLFQDCCRGRPRTCFPSFTPDSDHQGGAERMAPTRTYNALFICTGNSARSIFAEVLLRDLGGGRFNAFSAGSRPADAVNPFTIEMLRSKGHDVSRLRPKPMSEFQSPDAPVMDFVFTVCDQAANEECPVWLGQPVTAHWGVPDPAKAEGTEAEKHLAFQQAYGRLRNRISAFVALRPESLDRTTLQARVDEIAKTKDI